MSYIQIITPRLSLQPLGMKFLESTHAYSSDLENTKYMVFLPKTMKQETIDFLTEVDEQWKSANQMVYEFAILLNDVHIGAVSFVS